MLRLPLVALVLLILLTAAGTAEPVTADFFVAQNGNDTWSGKLAAPNADKTDGPFLTLRWALDTLKTLKGHGGKILLRAGSYRLEKMVQLYPENSGTKENPLVIAGYPGEQAVIDGGMPIVGAWSKVGDGPVWTVKTSGLARPVEDLFYNGQRQTCARMPDKGWWPAKAVGESRTQFQFEAGRLAAWPDLASGFVVMKPHEWMDETLPIKSIDEATHTLTTTKDGEFPLVADGGREPGVYYIENVRAALDQPGEWCFNVGSGELFFWPPDGKDPTNQVIAGGLPMLFSLEGNHKEGTWIENVILENLTFTRTGRYQDWRFFCGNAVRFNQGVRSCAVRHCLFQDLGGCGVIVWKEAENISITDNEFARVGDTAIKIMDYLGEGPAMSSGHVIENNLIHHGGSTTGHIGGIELDNVSNCRVAHNYIHDMPYVGINVNGMQPDNWQQKNDPKLNPPFTAAAMKPYLPCKNNIVEFNRISNVMQDLRDGGGIYFWGEMGVGHNFIRHNLVEHLGTGDMNAMGLYFDDYCDDVIATDNVVVDAGLGTHLHGASRNVLENNVFAYSRSTDISVYPEKYNITPMNSVIRHNIFYRCAGVIFLDTSWGQWQHKPLLECDYNLFWQDGKSVALGAGLYKGFDQHSLVADPKFVDPAKGDYTLQPDSPALKLGIKSIDLTGVGLSGLVGPNTP